MSRRIRACEAILDRVIPVTVWAFIHTATAGLWGESQALSTAIEYVLN